MRRAPRLLLVLAAALASCAQPESGQPPATPEAVQEPAPSRLDAASATTAAMVTPAVVAAVEALAPAEPPALPPPASPSCRKLSAQLIARWEITSQAYYEKRLQGVIWPKGASGLTWCIGYDGGHQTRVIILDDWQAHAQVDRLGQTAGLTGTRAAQALPQFRDITTPYPHCLQVFEERSLVEYERRAERAFNVDMAVVDPGICAALVSTVYNRGGAMTGDSRREMRAIRDECLPAFDGGCVAAQLRSMCRLWRGTANEKGLCARREMEASYATGDLP